MSTEPLVSIIVRTKNEERWIASCLRGIHRQAYGNVEVVLVDNRSTDQTVAKASPMVSTVVTIDEFKPGRAINLGIEASTGEILVCLSGHCIPTNEHWLGNLVRNVTDERVAGVYGRQEPLSYSSPLDKRDLLITFGLDRRVQELDSFFHNANSAFRRDVWDRFPFDEEVPNIEDRVWGKQVLQAGYVIVYEPESSVYHHHGIHHAGNVERAAQIVTIMERLEGTARPTPAHHSELDVVAIIPSRGASPRVGDRTLVELTIADALGADALDTVVVATDDDATSAAATALGARVIARPPELSEEYVGVGEVLQFALEEVEAGGSPPDLVVILEATHPFRPAGLIDEMVAKLLDEGLDSVIAGRPEGRRLWVRTDGRIEPVGSAGLLPRSLRSSEAFLGLFGLACVTRPEFIRDGSLLGDQVGIYEVRDPAVAIEVRTDADVAAVAPLLETWSKEHR